MALAALALSQAPVLVLDEPLAGLDAAAVDRVCALVDRLRLAGTALVLLTRSMDKLACGADEVLTLRGGRLHPGQSASRQVPAAPARRRTTDANAPVLLDFADAGIGYPGAAVPAVSGLDLQVHAGECVALAGANGSGKTTVLKAAAGLLAPGAGRVAVVSGAGVGLLLQNPADQLFERTVEREVAFGIARRGPQAARIPEILEALGLDGAQDTHPYELPASARRLVALATVLVREPAVLLLDEPTEALDAEGLVRLHAALRSVLERGGAVLLATHDEAFMDAVAHRVHRMEPAAGLGERPVS